MAPTDPNTTSRLRVHYTGPFGSHTQLFHGILGDTVAELVGSVQDYVDLVVAMQFDGTTWDTAEYAAEGSALFFPEASWSPITSASGINPTANAAPSAFIQFGGRDTSSGTRVKLYVFETWSGYTDNMRLTSGEQSLCDAVITELNSVDNLIGNIAGRTPIWYPYTNVGQNDYLTHKARS